MIINDKKHYDKVKETINMSNMRKLIDTKSYTITKLAMNACISESSVNAYLNGQKLPSVTTLVSLADFLNCNIDFLLGRANNPSTIDSIEQASSNPKLDLLIHNIRSLPENKQELVEAFVKGLMS